MKSLRRTSRTMASAVVGAGVIVIAGWVFDLDWVRSVFPHFVTMKFTTALCFILSGVAALIVAKPFSQRSTSENVALAMLAFSTVFIVQDQLYAYVYNYKSFWDNIYSEFSPVFTAVPGRPSVGTLILFLLIDLIELTYILNLNHNTYQARRLISGTVMTASLIALIGYLIDEPILYYYSEDRSTAMAIHTAVLFLVLGAAHFINSYVPTERKRVYFPQTKRTVN